MQQAEESSKTLPLAVLYIVCRKYYPSVWKLVNELRS